MKYTIEEIWRITLLAEVDAALVESRYQGEEAKRMREMIPADIAEQDMRMVTDVLSAARKMSQADLEALIRQLPPGYLRGECRLIWRDKDAQNG